MTSIAQPVETADIMDIEGGPVIELSCGHSATIAQCIGELSEAEDATNTSHAVQWTNSWTKLEVKAAVKAAVHQVL